MVELDPTGGVIFALNGCVSLSPDAGHHSMLLLGTHSHSPARSHSGGAFRIFPQPSSTPSSGLPFILLSPLFHRQLNMHKSSYSKRSSCWAVGHSCFLGNAWGYFSHLLPPNEFQQILTFAPKQDGRFTHCCQHLLSQNIAVSSVHS